MAQARRQQTVPTAEDNEDEDEETLRLRLDAIEARLKLKKLQQKKAKAASTTSDLENERPEDLQPKPSSALQIPLSPPRKHIVTEEKKSPGRILLGIDKGLKGRNVSLRRPPEKNILDEDPFTSTKRPNGSRASVQSSSGQRPSHEYERKTQSFSDRIAQIRRNDKEHQDRTRRARNERSTGFGVHQEEVEQMRNAVKSQPLEDARCKPLKKDGEFTREELLKAINKPNSGLARSRSCAQGTESSYVAKIKSTPRNAPSSCQTSRAAQATSDPPDTTRLPSPSPSDQPFSTIPAPESSDTLFEPFSTLHLSKRLLPHNLLTRTFAARPIVTIPSLLSTIKSPTYDLPPHLESDFVVLAIIASKSSPLSHRDARKSTADSSGTTSIAEAAESETNARGKYMVLTLTDLKWSLDLYLFTTAYTRFWKLTPGTVIAILNPSIMPPPPGKADTGRFSLVLNSSDDTILEIGTSRDLGWCKSLKRDGKPCGAWVDKRHTSVCEFHVDRVVEKTRAGRMEVNGMSAPYGPKGRGGGRTGFFGGGGRKGANAKGRDDGLLPAGGAQFDRRLGTSYFVAPGSSGRSAASLLDFEGALERGGSKEERARKRLAEQEKEREIARKLAEGGNGLAAEYMRRKHDSKKDPSAVGMEHQQESREAVDAAALGLMGNKAVNVHLSPIKKRKADAMGSERKKTRFVTKEGIKFAGRESGGGDVWLDAAADEDDELDIV